jgi:(2Fe-2S) ferredoxin
LVTCLYYCTNFCILIINGLSLYYLGGVWYTNLSIPWICSILFHRLHLNYIFREGICKYTSTQISICRLNIVALSIVYLN